jgi:DNA-binding IclR family transcriptional regulator
MQNEKQQQEEKQQESVRAVDRALDILLAFQPGDEELTVAQLLTRVDLSRPTLYRLLNALEHNDFLVSSGEPQRFRLGSSVARLAHVWTASHSLTQVAGPMMRSLWETTRETVALFVPEGVYRVCMAEMESPEPLSFRRGVGYREKLAVGASGRSILAQKPLTVDDLRPYLGDSAADPVRLAADLEDTRARGYATSRHELIQGAVAVAAPFFDGADEVAGSLCIFGPSVRLSEERVETCGRLLMQEAAALSRALGRQPRRSRR